MGMYHYGILVPSRLVKRVKDALETGGLLRKDIKIRKIQNYMQFQEILQIEQAEGFIVPTLVEGKSVDIISSLRKQSDSPWKSLALPEPLKTCLSHVLQEDKGIYTLLIDVETVSKRTGRKEASDLEKALNNGFASIEIRHRELLEPFLPVDLTKFPKQFSLFPPLVLLPSHDVKNGETWISLIKLLGSDRLDKTAWNSFFSAFASSLHVTHVALNAPIPASILSSKPPGLVTENVIRSPTGLTPLYGNFRPALPPFPEHIPSHADFSEAFWVTSKQNGINQTWAPRYTMFSAGNVTEKARILHLPTVAKAVLQGVESAKGSAAVDLFAGIGYFAFSYKKAGIDKVLCWDLNPWSVEGLRRGAEANKWRVSIVSSPNLSFTGEVDVDSQFIVFCESNEHAMQRFSQIQDKIPPIRHVNAGMLPTAAFAWKTAIEAVDAAMGGWIHLHESVRESAIDMRTTEILSAVQAHLDSLPSITFRPKIELEHVEKVKSVAPKTMHIVLDIYIPPRQLIMTEDP